MIRLAEIKNIQSVTLYTMRNFEYLQSYDYLTDLYKYCNAAELAQQSDPDKSALNSRRALEWLVRAIYEMKGIEIGPRTSLFELIDGEPFSGFMGDEQLMKAVHYVRKVGNRAAHNGEASRKESFFSLLNLYNIVGSVLVKLRVVDDYPVFDKQLIPSVPPVYVEPAAEVPQASALVAEVPAEQILNEPVAPHPTGLTEAETRRYFIDLSLRESGWEVLEQEGAVAPGKACIEIPVKGMPSASGDGFADYVLFGTNGKPLAVVEAKRTSKNPKIGRHQAELYADCLEKQYGVRPVVYYTNGYQTEVIDGLGYPPRIVYGYHTAKELELLILRRGRHDITNLNISDAITNREYQKRAVRQVCERFNQKQRRSLLIMATGTGKTRVSISLVDVLQRNSWVKNVLFLADRTALVKQAAKNYARLLPSNTTCILSEDDKPDMTARIMFSTYQTMINYIDNDTKEFSIGRFDLIIIDEAHRSVFGKYVSIFEYFDSLLVGLTATPRDEVDRNTFDLFNMEVEQTFSYEHQEAVKDGYLVDYNPLKRGTMILKEGIIYNQLSDEEKHQLDAVWKYEKAKNAIGSDNYSRDIGSNEIFKYIFNLDTIDKVIQDLMTHGQLIHSGECIGKTIIFAYNHHHAQLIEERFHALYPQYGAEFCRVIDNYEKYAQDLINKFEVRDTLPQIAVSVDMLDTGIDVPDILNLVFFKPVHSYIKFIQMIGRGTRLSENIFGPGEDKQIFLIFDWCNNFEFFSLNPNGVEGQITRSLTEKLFGLRTDIAYELQSAVYQEDEFSRQFHDDLKTLLHSQVAELSDSQIAVRMNWEKVDRFRRKENWQCLTALDVNVLKDEISPLLVKTQTDEKAKQFDCLILDIMLSCIVPSYRAQRSQNKVIEIATLLQDKASIPQVLAKMPVIQEILGPTFWEEPSLSNLERIRIEVRDLVKFLFSAGGNQTFTINIRDKVVEEGEGEYFTPRSYKQRIFDYLNEHKDLPAIQKIINMVQLERSDIVELENILWKELGSKEDYERYIEYGNLLCGDQVAVFIRSIVGVDRQKALQKYSSFLSSHVLNSEQEEFLKTIIDYVCTNGDITPSALVNDPNFSEVEWLDIFGEDAIHLKNYVEELHNMIVA